MEIHENLKKNWKSMKMHENQWKSIKIYENPWKSMKMHEIHEHVLDIFILKEKMGYILYSKNISASRICPPERNKWFKQKKWKSWFSGKHGLWFVQHGSKSLFWWKSEMIPRSFRSFCPRRCSFAVHVCSCMFMGGSCLFMVVHGRFIFVQQCS